MSQNDQAHGFIVGKLPAVVASYNKQTRECRVHIAGLTDSAAMGMLAEIEYPIGDKSADGEFSTDILITAGNPVWVEFEAGDARYPIITGFRNARTGNGTDWRRFHQANMELLAQQLMNFIAGGVITIKSGAKVHVIAPEVLVEAPESTFTGNVAIAGGLSVAGGGSGGRSTIRGNFAIEGGSLTHNGKNVGSTHTHTEQGDGAPVSGPY